MNTRHDALKQAIARIDFTAMAQEIRDKKAAQQAFLDTPRFAEIAAYLQTIDGGVDSEMLAYFPERYAITTQELNDICTGMLDAHAEIVSDESANGFPTYVVAARGVKVTLMIGQGSSLFLEADRTAPQPALTP